MEMSNEKLEEQARQFPFRSQKAKREWIEKHQKTPTELLRDFENIKTSKSKPAH